MLMFEKARNAEGLRLEPFGRFRLQGQGDLRTSENRKIHRAKVLKLLLKAAS